MMSRLGAKIHILLGHFLLHKRDPFLPRSPAPARLARLWRGLALLVLLLISTSSPAHSKTREQRWTRDIDYLARKLPKKCPGLFQESVGEEFRAALADLRSRIVEASDAEILVGLARILARAGDPHTHLYLLQGGAGFRVYPLRFHLYDEGLYVSSATPAYRRTIGSRVRQVGRVPIEEALAAVKEIISADTEMGVKLFSAVYLRSPEILQALGLVDDMESAGFLLEDARGEVFYAQPEPISLGLAHQAKFISWAEATGGTDSRLMVKNPETFYWFESLEDSKALFVQLNRIENARDETFSRFCRRLFEFLDGHPVERLILDLRWNVGTRRGLDGPLVEGLARRRLGREPGKLFVLIGRGTYAAAAETALHLKEATDALLVGEPMRSAPRPAATIKWLRLPESKTRISYPKITSEGGARSDPRPSLAPDLKTPQAISDARDGVDRDLETALGYRSP